MVSCFVYWILLEARTSLKAKSLRTLEFLCCLKLQPSAIASPAALFVPRGVRWTSVQGMVDLRTCFKNALDRRRFVKGTSER